MKNNKTAYILYQYNKFSKDYEYIKEYYNIKELQKDNAKDFKLKNTRSIYHYIRTELSNDINLLNNRYLIIREIL